MENILLAKNQSMGKIEKGGASSETLEYTPAENYHGTDTFTFFQIVNGHKGEVKTVILNVHLSEINELYNSRWERRNLARVWKMSSHHRIKEWKIRFSWQGKWK